MKKAISVKGMASTHAEAVSGTSQKIAVEMMAPSIQNTQVRWARLPKIWSVAQPATTMPRLAAHELEDGYHDARHGDRYALLRTGQEHHAPVEHREANDVDEEVGDGQHPDDRVAEYHAAQERLVVGGVRRWSPSSPRRPAVRPAFPARAVRPTTACRAA